MKKAGNAPSEINAGVTKLSTSPPRRQAAIIPSGVPRTKANMKPMPTSAME